MKIQPAFAWAAVAPDGGIFRDGVRPRAREVREYIGAIFGVSYEPSSADWRRAYRRGWRVIRVEISPAFADRLRQAPSGTEGRCDCQRWPTHVSNECPVHNLHPDQPGGYEE